MIRAIIEGIILGITLAFMIGPAFFSLIQTSISRGFKAGFQLAIGISLSDMILIFMVNLGIVHVIDSPKVQLAFGIIGGIILILFGLYTFLKKEISHNTHEVEIDKRFSRAATYVIKGFLLNFANPFVWFFWIMVSVGMSSNLQTKENIIIFFSATLATLLSTDTLKCFIANRIKRFLSGRILFIINKSVAVLLLGFGVVLIIRVLLQNFNKL